MSEINVAQPRLSLGSATLPGMGHLLGYARVSTTDQHPQLQVDALERAGSYRVFTETASGARTDRPTLEQLLDMIFLHALLPNRTFDAFIRRATGVPS